MSLIFLSERRPPPRPKVDPTNPCGAARLARAVERGVLQLDRGVRDYLRRAPWLIQSLPLVKTLRTQEPRDQRTGSIKCSYCVPGHMT